MTLQYSKSLATNLRNGAKMAQASYPDNRGTVVMETYFSLMMSPSRATETKSAFLSWYRTMYNMGRTPDILIDHEIYKMPPFQVCGLLNEFADLVEETVEVSEILEAAAEAIKTYGWAQGTSVNGRNGLCVVAAVDYVLLEKYGAVSARGWHIWTAVIGALTEYLQTARIIEWNDASGRTANEVYGVLKEVAAGIRSIKH